MILSSNTDLPELPVWQARSFWAQLLLLAIGLCTAWGVDLMGILGAMGLGSNPEEVLATGDRAVSAVQVLLMIGAGIWSWIERHAPNYRLVWRWRTGG